MPGGGGATDAHCDEIEANVRGKEEVEHDVEHFPSTLGLHQPQPRQSSVQTPGRANTRLATALDRSTNAPTAGGDAEWMGTAEGPQARDGRNAGLDTE